MTPEIDNPSNLLIGLVLSVVVVVALFLVDVRAEFFFHNELVQYP